MANRVPKDVGNIFLVISKKCSQLTVLEEEISTGKLT